LSVIQLHRWISKELTALGAELAVGLAAGVAVAPPSHRERGVLGLFESMIWALRHGGVLLSVHIALALIVWSLATFLVLSAWRARQTSLTLWLTVAWIGVSLAGLAGGSLVDGGGAPDSFFMILGALMSALGSIAAWGLTAPRRED